MNKSSFILFLLLLLMTCASAYSQESDFGLWYEVNAEKSLGKKFDLSGSLNVRTFENASTVDKAFLELGASYDPNKYLGFAGSYRIGSYLEKDDLYHRGQQIFTDIKGSVPVNNFEFSTRVRLQITKRSYSKEGSSNPTEYDGRIKLKGKYKIPHFPLDPYLSFEIFTPMFRSSEQFVSKSRSTAGVDYKISKKHLAGMEYTYQRDNTPHLKIINLITVSYTYRF